MVESSSYDDPDYEPDPLFVNSLHEARWILLMWVVCLIWTLSVCLNSGYPDTVTPETFPLVMGIPAWVAYGIALPWVLANIVTISFCLGYMKDGDLGEDPAVDSAKHADSLTASGGDRA